MDPGSNLIPVLSELGPSTLLLIQCHSNYLFIYFSAPVSQSWYQLLVTTKL